MKIEVGKKYRNGLGEVVTVVKEVKRPYVHPCRKCFEVERENLDHRYNYTVLEYGVAFDPPLTLVEEVVEPDPHIGKRYVLDGSVCEVLSKDNRGFGSWYVYVCKCVETGWKLLVRASDLTEEYVPPPPKKRFYVTATVELEVMAENIEVARNMASRYIDTAQLDDVSLEDYHTHEVIED